jgi:hypothetical protein
MLERSQTEHLKWHSRGDSGHLVACRKKIGLGSPDALVTLFAQKLLPMRKKVRLQRTCWSW